MTDRHFLIDDVAKSGPVYQVNNYKMHPGDPAATPILHKKLGDYALNYNTSGHNHSIPTEIPRKGNDGVNPFMYTGQPKK